MSSTTETQTQSAHTQGEKVQSEQSKFVQHLATYPAVSALAGLVASFPVAKIFVSNAVPLLHAIHERSKPIADPIAETAAPYLQTLDKVGDGALNRVDERFPQLKKLQPSDVYGGAQEYIGSVRGQAKAVYDARIGKPVANAANAAKHQYDSVYDKQVASYVGPLNDKLESAIDQIFPAEDDKVPELEKSDRTQIKRTYDLARLAAERATPKLKEVYTKKLDERRNGDKTPGYIAKILAALATGRYISVESYSLVLDYFGSSAKLHNAVEQVKNSTEDYQETVEKAAAEIVKEANGVSGVAV